MKVPGARSLALAALCLLASAAQAATGLTVLRAPADSGPITVFHPTDATPARVQRGPFTLSVAVDAAPAAGNHRLIVMSHGSSGSGGSGWENSDLAQALVGAGFTVAMPEHAGDNWHDHSGAGPLDSVRIAVARRIIHARFDEDTAWQEARDARIAAVVAAVPMAANFDMRSLAHPRVPLGLVRAGRDAWLAPQWHIDAVRAACNGCVLLADMKEAGHGSIMSPPVRNLPPRAARLLDDPPGFDRRTLDGTYAAIVQFFVQNLQS